MRKKEYQVEVSHATKFESVEDDVFRIGFYEELGEFTSLLPTDREMESITVITSGSTEGKTYSKLTIDISGLNVPKGFFQKRKCGFGFMFKIRTRDFLTKESMRQMINPGGIWTFNSKIYPIHSSLTVEEQKKLINLHEANIWTILPEGASIFHLNPPPRTVMMMEKEDEELENAHAEIKGPYKTYKAGQIAICWDLKNVAKEVIMNYIGQSPLGMERSDIENVWKKIEDMGNSIKNLVDEFKLSEKRIAAEQKRYLIELRDLKESLPKQYISYREMIAIIGLLITIFSALLLFV